MPERRTIQAVVDGGRCGATCPFLRTGKWPSCIVFGTLTMTVEMPTKERNCHLYGAMRHAACLALDPPLDESQDAGPE